MTSLPQYSKESARNKYFCDEYDTLESLAEAEGISVNTLKNWVYYGTKNEEPWSVTKKREHDQNIVELIEKSYKKDRLLKDKLTDLGLKVSEIIAEGLKNNIYEASEHSKLLNALSSFKKASDANLRLDEGKSTSNIEVKQSKEVKSLDDMLKIAEEDDPFNKT